MLTLANHAAERSAIEAEPLFQNVGALFDHALDVCADRPLWIFADDDRASLTNRDLGALIARSANAFTAMGGKKRHTRRPDHADRTRASSCLGGSGQARRRLDRH